MIQRLYGILVLVALLGGGHGFAQTPLVSGQSVFGSLDSEGESDRYSFPADAGDTIIVQAGEVEPDDVVGFFVSLTLLGPGGELRGDDSSADDAEITITAPETGTYTVVVEDGSGRSPSSTGPYRLEVATVPGGLVVSPGDEGGNLDNGRRVTGEIELGDFDTWRIDAAEGDTLIVQLGERFLEEGVGFSAVMTVYRPDGTQQIVNGGIDDGEVTIIGTAAGTYSIVVEDGDGTSPTSTGFYQLEALVIPGAFGVAPFDEGGALESGRRVGGDITLGDFDVWSLSAAVGDTIIAKIGERGTAPGEGFFTDMQIYRPDGSLAGDDSGADDSEVTVSVTQSGTYTIIIEDGNGASPTSTGSYELEAAVIPGPFVVSAGDEGGPLLNGRSCRGEIVLGDFDLWTIDASAGDTIIAKVGERFPVESVGFHTALLLFRPDGSEQIINSSADDAEITVVAPMDGRYTLVVENGGGLSPTSTGFYEIKAAVVPRAFVVEPDTGEGQLLTGPGTFDGAITLGNFDVWAFSTSAGASISATVTQTSADPEEFRISLVLYHPDGSELRSDTGRDSAAIDVTAPVAGDYTIVIEDGSGASSTSTGTYQIEISGSDIRAPTAPSLALADRTFDLRLVRAPFAGAPPRLRWNGYACGFGLELLTSTSLEAGSFAPAGLDVRFDGLTAEVVLLPPLDPQRFFALGIP